MRLCRDINSVWERNHTLINVLRFSLSDSIDGDCAFAGLLLCIFNLLVNEFLQSEIMQKSGIVQNIRSLITVADE